ncbi:MAG: aminoacyl-tRNA hydrolase [Gemmatimonadales bacterium]|nr:aminoacyl-tRNA hydrolase [Gemmatimonadales bacterium]
MVGLGNPGPEYADTRHNAGFRLADRLVDRWKLPQFTRGDRARETRGNWLEFPVRILKPQTYMNRSGAAVAPLRTLPGFDPSQHLLILVDDVALPAGRFRLRGAGSAGGHNGLKSIEGVLQRQDYARLRIGVGPPPPGPDELSDFVLGSFTAAERELIEALLDPMSEAVESWIENGIEQAMNRFNKGAS